MRLLMWRPLFLIGTAACGVLMASCSTPGSISSNGDSSPAFRSYASRGKVPSGTRQKVVRTTAYTACEPDHVKYGTRNAVGTQLKYGRVRSAAADWSKYPVGTVFRIKGEPYLYEVDDYGSALVGTETIDLFKPSRGTMNEWGVRNVPIEILRWGSYRKSLEILEPRTKHSHVREMVTEIRRKS